MKYKHRKEFGISALICGIILLGFAAMVITSYAAYSEVIRDDVKNISKLTASGIYSDIQNELTKPIFVSLTMANDSFLKAWLKNEAPAADQASHEQLLFDYLNGIRDKYGYDSVFLVSAASQRYYYYGGLNKVISPNDEHDQWYYNFADSGQTYVLDVDTDEVNQGRLSIFVNCRIVDDNGALLGVTGVGLELSELQEMLKRFGSEFNLSAELINPAGIVQVSATTEDVNEKNVFERPEVLLHQKSILNNTTSLEIFSFNDVATSGYYISRYVDDLGWYLLVRKDISSLVQSFHEQLVRDFLIYLAVTASVLIVVGRLVNDNERKLLAMAKTDSLTGLPNRRSFAEHLEAETEGLGPNTPLCIFVFDIDNFKQLNDNYGHVLGDEVLKYIGKLATQEFASLGTVYRWGGDEFSGIMHADTETVAKKAQAFFERIQADAELTRYGASISMGAAAARDVDTAQTLVYRADRALYNAKERGKNRFVFLSKEDA